MFNWNPWHGCHKHSEGCKNCYMYVLDIQRGIDPTVVRKSEKMFDFPVQRCKNGTYKFKQYYLNCCFTSDFFIEEADEWRKEIWKMFKERSEVKFLIYTKRVERMLQCLPADWGNGYDNVMFVVTCENQARADERIPQFLSIPCKWHGIGISPMLGPVNIERYFVHGQIDEVLVCGEGYSSNSTPLNYDWLLDLKRQCDNWKVSIVFQETGNKLIKDGRLFNIPYDKQKEQAKLSGISKKYTKKQRIKLVESRLGNNLTIYDLM